MVFSSLFFVTVFLPIVLISAWALEKILRKLAINPLPKINFLLLFYSLFFYFWGEGLGVLWLLASILFNDLSARAIHRCGKAGWKKAFLGFSVIGNLVFLGWFKYSGFFASTINSIQTLISIPIPAVALPLGISFYTFQAMSYVIDVYRKEVQPSKSILNFACYVTMFPQLVAGPIVRYIDVENNLIARRMDWARIASGMRRFLCGLVKKVLIANSVAEFADTAWKYADSGQVIPIVLAWMGVLAYAIQIYYDFSGYSDMAIGIGRMLGFEFLENFRHPYSSTSVREFWRRWHISLSTWFRDYLYIPLGGNRKGLFFTCANSVIVFALCGLWHGASFMFLLWGLWHGLFLMLERLWMSVRKVSKNAPPTSAVVRFMGHLYTIAVFLFGWVLFRSESFASMACILKSLFGMGEPARETLTFYIEAAPKFLLALVVGIVFSYPIVPTLRNWLQKKKPNLYPIADGVVWGMLTIVGLVAILFVAGGSYNPFIYFRF